MVRPERFELPTNRFEADYSIQLSYGRLIHNYNLYQLYLDTEAVAIYRAHIKLLMISVFKLNKIYLIPWFTLIPFK